MKTSNSRFRLLQKVRPYLTTLSAKTLYQTMILPIITYGSLVNLNLTETQRNRMNRFHNCAVDIILYRDTKIDRNDIVSLIQSFSIKACKIVRKSLDGSTCSNFLEYFQRSNHNKNTRNNKFSAKLPKIRLEYVRKSFYYMGAYLYNKLPIEIRKIEDMHTFKKELARCLKTNLQIM